MLFLPLLEHNYISRCFQRLSLVINALPVDFCQLFKNKHFALNFLYLPFTTNMCFNSFFVDGCIFTWIYWCKKKMCWYYEGFFFFYLSFFFLSNLLCTFPVSLALALKTFMNHWLLIGHWIFQSQQQWGKGAAGSPRETQTCGRSIIHGSPWACSEHWHSTCLNQTGPVSLTSPGKCQAQVKVGVTGFGDGREQRWWSDLKWVWGAPCCYYTGSIGSGCCICLYQTFPFAFFAYLLFIHYLQGQHNVSQIYRHTDNSLCNRHVRKKTL